MSTNGNEPGGIQARRIEAENVVSGVQMQGGDAQTGIHGKTESRIWTATVSCATLLRNNILTRLIFHQG